MQIERTEICFLGLQLKKAITGQNNASIFFWNKFFAKSVLIHKKERIPFIILIHCLTEQRDWVTSLPFSSVTKHNHILHKISSKFCTKQEKFHNRTMKIKQFEVERETNTVGNSIRSFINDIMACRDLWLPVGIVGNRDVMSILLVQEAVTRRRSKMKIVRRGFFFLSMRISSSCGMSSSGGSGGASLQHFSPSRLHLWGMCLALNFTENVTSEKQGMRFFCKCPRVCDERKIKGEVGRNPVDIAKAWVHKTWGRGRVFLRRSEAATLFFAKTFLHGISRGFSDLLLDTRTCILQLIEGEKMSWHQVRFSTLATPQNLGLEA